MITIVTGGSRSGKSEFAENIFAKRDDVCYIATAQIYDDEMSARVKLHRDRRPKTWSTSECICDFDSLDVTAGAYLLDSLGVYASNIMFKYTADLEKISDEIKQLVEDAVYESVLSLIKSVRLHGGDLVIVTDELGQSIVPENAVARAYRDIVGRVNQKICAASDAAYLVVMGIGVRLK